MNPIWLTVLGTAAAVPSFEYYTSGLLLSNLNDEQWLIDCGEGIQVPFFRYGGNYNKLRRIFISHLHADHYIGLVGLIMSMHMHGRKLPLTIYAPHGLAEILTAILRASDTQLKYAIEYYTVPEDTLSTVYKDSRWEVVAFPLKHRIPTVGYRITQIQQERRFLANEHTSSIPFEYIRRMKAGENILAEDGTLLYHCDDYTEPLPKLSFAYCSDTAYDERIIEYCKEVTLLYHEATFLEQDRVLAEKTFHSTAQEAATIAQKCGAKHLLLGHFSYRYPNRSVFREEAERIFPSVYIAKEGMQLNLNQLNHSKTHA
ncbi:ribonuclease Z [Thermonema lapsum]|uniref:Ribonuclease Z n=1 Tax=Thermonema lapsum TaxID=28195 RepID=A0A846MN06_9BACT|nr:ribonuclease Z [Thermonema lapsum]NIK72884.1 ribonuclease Z [Thermonema lapsum]